MTCSGSSSSSRVIAPLLLAAALAATGCGGGRAVRPDGTRPIARIALLPAENLTGIGAVGPDLLPRLANEFARTGVDVVFGDAVEEFLREHRFRYTGGVSSELAVAAREQLKVDALVVTSVVARVDSTTPTVALTTRLVSTDEIPVILWIDGIALSGNDHPGPFDLGLVRRVGKLERKAASVLGRSLRQFLTGSVRASACPREARFAPSVSYRSPEFVPDRVPIKMVVMPFANESGREAAGDVLALEFTRHVLARGEFQVLEPGYVRERLLASRVVLEGGLSSAVAEVLRSAVGVDVVLGGEVREYADAELGRAAAARFGAVLLDGRDGRLVWSATSYHEGSEDVVLFEKGMIDRAATLACRMVSAAVAEFPTSRARPARGLVSR